ncbi:MAG: hypothetical protein K6G74_04230 [Bacilli bacterium]|nr:hypothetical protein [Bacilli bacterium]
MEVLGNSKTYSSIFNTYLGKGQAHTTTIEGAEDWDTDYYDQTCHNYPAY